MDIRIEYDDMATPFLEELVQNNPKWITSALKSAAFYSQKAIKAGIKSGAPGGRPYTQHTLSDWERGKLEMALGHKSRRSYPMMGRLQQAVGYDTKQAAAGTVVVGWLSQSAAYISGKQQRGFTSPMTDKMRAAFFAAGLHPSDKKTVTRVPPRPTLGPMVPIVTETATQTMQRRLMSYVSGNTARSAAASNRVYKVYK